MGVLILYSYPFALVFAKMSVRHPTSKGVAQFVEAAFGVRAGRIAAVFLLLTLLAGNPVLGLAVSRYLLAAVDPRPRTGRPSSRAPPSSCSASRSTSGESG